MTPASRNAAEFADRGNYFVGQLTGACVDNHRALVARLNGDVASVSNQHVEVVTNW